MRKFSLPFNGTNTDRYLSKLEPFKNSVENIFLGIPSLISNHQNYKQMVNDNNNIGNNEKQVLISEYENNCYEFLLKTKGKFKRILTLNSACYNLSDKEMKIFVLTKLEPILEKYYVEGLILTDFNMAKFIHEMYPMLELHTSCNCFQWNIKTMDIWREQAGISVFNPPREILRSPDKLKEMKNAGFILKCLVNEGCLYGCPQTINHCMYLANNVCNVHIDCIRGDISNVLRGNWVLPRWFKYLDEYVDIYKLSGRTIPNSELFRMVENYILEKDVGYLDEYIFGGSASALINEKIKIDIKDIPDKLLTCQCSDCNKTCFICSQIMQNNFENLKEE